MSSRRSQIISALETRCSSITTGNGYATNIGENVEVNADADRDPVSQDVSAGIVIRETGATHMPGMAGEDFATLEFELRVFASAFKGSEPEETCRNGFADLIEALGTDKTLGGLCDDMVSSNSNFAQFQSGKRHSTISCLIRIVYRTTRWDATAASPN